MTSLLQFLVQRFYGVKSLKVALSHHLCARIQSCRGDFRSALNSEREAYQIYRAQVSWIETTHRENCFQENFSSCLVGRWTRTNTWKCSSFKTFNRTSCCSSKTYEWCCQRTTFNDPKYHGEFALLKRRLGTFVIVTRCSLID